MRTITLMGSRVPYLTVEPAMDLAPYADPRRGSRGNGVVVQPVEPDGTPSAPPIRLTSWGTELLERYLREAREEATRL